MTSLTYLDIYIGDKEIHGREEAAYSATCALLSKNAQIYGLPATPPELSEEQRDILRELDVRSPSLVSTAGDYNALRTYRFLCRCASSPRPRS